MPFTAVAAAVAGAAATSLIGSALGSGGGSSGSGAGGSNAQAAVDQSNADINMWSARIQQPSPSTPTGPPNGARVTPPPAVGIASPLNAQRQQPAAAAASDPFAMAKQWYNTLGT